MAQKKTTKKEKIEERKDSSIKFFIYAIAILLLVIALTIGIKYFYKPSAKTNAYTYNNFLFTNITGLWVTEIQKAGTNKLYGVPLHYGPLELENISVEGDVDSFKNSSEIHITFVPTEKTLGFIALSASELSINLAQTFDITPVAACTKNETVACLGRPVIDCESPSKPAIFLNHANETRVYVKNNCIIVEGPGKELVKATDRLLLKWFSVMK